MKETKDLILVGGGGHCKSVIDVAESAGYRILGVLDTPDKVGESILGTKVVGTDDEIPNYVDKALFLVTVGQIKDVSLRKKLQERIRLAGGSLATVVASTAHVSPYACIGDGTVIMHQAVVNAGARIGVGCIVNTFANIEHDACIHDFCHISTGVMVNGNCTVGQDCFLGSQSVLANGISIVEGCIVSLGSTVRKDLTVRGIYSGNPAKLKIER